MLRPVPHSNIKDSMRNVLGRRAAPTLTRLAVAGVVAVSALATAQSASALSFAYYNGGLGAGAQAAGQSVGGYTATYNGADGPNHKIEAAAHYEGGWSLHGSYVDGWGAACHDYDGSRTLGGMIRNPHSVSQNPAGGISYYAILTTC
jgi:hypothetical protein